MKIPCQESPGVLHQVPEILLRETHWGDELLEIALEPPASKLDQDQETLIKLRGGRFKSYLEKFIPPVSFAEQYLGNLMKNARTFLARDFHMDSGKKYLIESFYRSITHGTPVPIQYREILLTARIMDTIFAQLNTQRSQVQAQGQMPSHAALTH